MWCNIIPLLTGLCSALLGGLIGWNWLKNSRLAPALGLIDEKEEHIGNLQSDIANHKVSYKSLSDEKHSLTTSLSDWKGKHGNVTTELAALGAAKLAIDNSFAKHKTDSATTISNLEAELAAWKKKHVDSVAAHNNTQSELSALQNTHTTAQRTFETKERELDGQIKEAGTRYMSLKSNHESAVENVRHLTVQSNTLTAEKTNLTQSIAFLKAENARKIADLQDSYETLVSVRDDLNTELQQKTHEYTEGVAAWSSKHNSLENQLVQTKETAALAGNEWEGRYRAVVSERDSLNKHIQQKERETTEAVSAWQAKYGGLETQLTQIKETAAHKGSEWETRYNSMVNERNNFNSQLNATKIHAEKAADEFDSKSMALEIEIERLKNELSAKPQGITLRDKDEVEKEQTTILERIKNRVSMGNTQLRIKAWGGGKADNLKRLRGVNAFIEKKMNAVGLHTYRQVAYLENDEQTQLNEILELTNKKFQKEEWVFQAKRLIGLISEESPDAVLLRIRTQTGGMNYDRIGSASAENKDNLQLVNYITAFDEAKLNALGIFKYGQIANFNKTDVKLVNKLIEIEEGRIGNEDWVTQANYLNTSAFEATLSRISGRQDLVEWSRIGKVDIAQQEDLQVVSGIGLFIEQKLYALGIHRLEQIAKFNGVDETEMNNILELVSGHIQGDKWVEQAKAIVKGRK